MKRGQKIDTRKRLEQMNTPEARFVLRALRIQDSHGGQPTASIGPDGQIVFTYPDGVKTCGGVRIA